MSTAASPPPPPSVPPPPDTGPELQEEFDSDRALKTIMFQVAAIFQTLPKLMEAMNRITAQQAEHERRIIRLEGIVELQREHERRIGILENLAGVAAITDET